MQYKNEKGMNPHFKQHNVKKGKAAGTALLIKVVDANVFFFYFFINVKNLFTTDNLVV